MSCSLTDSTGSEITSGHQWTWIFHCCQYCTTFAGLAVKLQAHTATVKQSGRVAEMPFQTQLRESKWITICMKGQETLVTFNDGATGDIVNMRPSSEVSGAEKHFTPLNTTKLGMFTVKCCFRNSFMASHEFHMRHGGEGTQGNNDHITGCCVQTSAFLSPQQALAHKSLTASFKWPGLFSVYGDDAMMRVR